MIEKNVNTIIKRAFQVAKIKSGDVDLTETELNDARYSLNSMLKSWDNRGFHIWKWERGGLLLNKGKESYAIPEELAVEKIIKTQILKVEQAGQYFLPLNYVNDLYPEMDIAIRVRGKTEYKGKIVDIDKENNKVRLSKEFFNTCYKGQNVFIGIDLIETFVKEDVEDSNYVKFNNYLPNIHDIIMFVNDIESDKVEIIERRVIATENDYCLLDKPITLSKGITSFISPIIYKKEITEDLSLLLRKITINNFNKEDFKENQLFVMFDNKQNRIFDKISIIDNKKIVLEKEINFGPIDEVPENYKFNVFDEFIIDEFPAIEKENITIQGGIFADKDVMYKGNVFTEIAEGNITEYPSYYSFDKGITWQEDSLKNLIAINYINGKYYAATSYIYNANTEEGQEEDLHYKLVIYSGEKTNTGFNWIEEYSTEENYAFNGIFVYSNDKIILITSNGMFAKVIVEEKEVWKKILDYQIKNLNEIPFFMNDKIYFVPYKINNSEVLDGENKIVCIDIEDNKTRFIEISEMVEFIKHSMGINSFTFPNEKLGVIEDYISLRNKTYNLPLDLILNDINSYKIFIRDEEDLQKKCLPAVDIMYQGIDNRLSIGYFLNGACIFSIDNNKFYTILQKQIKSKDMREDKKIILSATLQGNIKKPDMINNVDLYSIIDSREQHLNIISRNDYQGLPKSSNSIPTQIYYDRQLEYGYMNLWNTPNDDHLFLEFDYIESLNPMENPRDIPDFPDQFVEAVIYNLAYKLAIEYGVPTDDLVALKTEAESILDIAEMHDNEDTSIFIQPGD